MPQGIGTVNTVLQLLEHNLRRSQTHDTPLRTGMAEASPSPYLLDGEHLPLIWSITKDKNELASIELRDDTVGDEHFHNQLMDQVNDASERIRDLAREHGDMEQAISRKRQQRLNRSNLLLAYLIDEEADPSTFCSTFSSELMDALGRISEVSHQIGGEENKRTEIQEAETKLQHRIEAIGFQAECDLQLLQLSQSEREIADKRIARSKGRLCILQRRKAYCDQALKELNQDRREADNQLCEKMEHLLVDNGLIEAVEAGGRRKVMAANEVEAISSQDDPHETSGEVSEGLEMGDKQLDQHSRQESVQASENSDTSNIAKLLAAKEQARQDLAQAWDRFVDLQEGHSQELRNYDVLRRPNRTRSEYDRSHLQSRMVWSGRITTAEQALEHVRIRLRDAGRRPSSAASSKFPSRASDGYSEDWEEAQKVLLDRPKVESWLENLDEHEAPSSVPMSRPVDVPLMTWTRRNRLVEDGDSAECAAAGSSAEN
ncbi:hypothetical protein LTR37_008063 [Vermiconidia calcicola]|uniref:Uncharacterized protein n=1 Tax=Vermiconidia calcicola TaxID=1690605 RepID=A0ACC3NBP1_9PEZI|nr:hypothetical protein LTR37_008063 [Vermiconidia calcicola]